MSLIILPPLPYVNIDADVIDIAAITYSLPLFDTYATLMPLPLAFADKRH